MLKMFEGKYENDNLSNNMRPVKPLYPVAGQGLHSEIGARIRSSGR